MELFNFTLSFLRLGKRVKIHIDLTHSAAVPLALSVISVYLAKSLFVFSGSAEIGIWLVLEIIFALSVFVAFTVAASILAPRPEK